MSQQTCPKCGQPYDVRKLNWWAKNSKGRLYNYDAWGHRRISGRRKLVEWCRISKGQSIEPSQRKELDYSNIPLEDRLKGLKVKHGGGPFVLRGLEYPRNPDGVRRLFAVVLDHSNKES